MAEEFEDIEREVPGASDAAGHISAGQSRVYMRPGVRSRTKGKEITTQQQAALTKGLHIRQAIARGQAKAIYGNVYGDVHFASDGSSRNERTSYSNTRSALTPSLDRHLNISGELRAQTVLVTLLFLKILEEILKCLLVHAAALNRGQATAEPFYTAADSTLAFSRAGPRHGLIDGGLGDSPLVQTLAAVGHLFERLVESEEWPDIGPAIILSQVLHRVHNEYLSDTRISMVKVRSDATSAMYAFATSDPHPGILSYLLRFLLPTQSEDSEECLKMMRSLMQTSCRCLPSANPLRLLCSVSEQTDRIALFWYVVALSKNRLYVPLAEEDSPKHLRAFTEQIRYAEMMSDLGDVLESSNRLHELMRQAEARNNQWHIASICRTLGIVKEQAASHYEARMFLEKALALHKELEIASNSQGMCTQGICPQGLCTQRWLGIVLINQEEWSAAEECYAVALRDCNSDDSYQKHSVRGLFRSLWNQGKYYEAKKLQRRYPEYLWHENITWNGGPPSNDGKSNGEETDCYEGAWDNAYGSDKEERQREDSYSDHEIYGARRSFLNEAWDSIEQQTHVLEHLACPASRRKSI